MFLFHQDPLLRSPKQPIKQNMTLNQDSQKVPDITLILILILRQTHHFKKVSCQKHFKDQTNHSFKNPKIRKPRNKGNFVHKIFAKTDGLRQNTRSDTEKSVKRHIYAHGSKRNSGSLSV